MTTTKTKEFVGQYHVYANGDQRWYRVEGSQPEWYLYKVNATGEQIGDGEYVDFNPARGTS